MTHVVIMASRLKYILFLVAAAGFVAGGVFMLLHNGPLWVAWLNILFFGSAIPLFIWQIIDRRPRLVFDDEGVSDRTLDVGKILWRDINGAYLRSIQGNVFVCLHISDAEKYLGRLSPIKKAAAGVNEQLGFTPLSLNLSGVSVDPNQMLELVLKMSNVNNVRQG